MENHGTSSRNEGSSWVYRHLTLPGAQVHRQVDEHH